MSTVRVTWHRVFNWAILVGYRVECSVCGTVARTSHKVEAQRARSDHIRNHRKDPS